MTIHIALFEPEIPQNTGTILRIADCFGVHLHIVEPCGFIFGGKHMKRASMDYLQTVQYSMYNNFEEFQQHVNNNNLRLVLATTKASEKYYDFSFASNDIILFGKETSGLPNYIHNLTPYKIFVPMQLGKRSLNIAVSCGIIVSEAVKQLKIL
jgi:tRNA (cytidine/uridine-2'-O-)-methyltransferase